MVARAARELRDDDVVFVGIGLPNMACNLARLTHAPHLTLIYESGAVGAVPERLPVSIGDPALVAGCLSVCSLPEVFLYYLQGGRITVGFLGGAQIDRFGNINSTVIGDYAAPKVRLPGSGGASEIATLAQKILIITPLKKRNFPEAVDFLTSPGFLDGGDARARLGITTEGPKVVVTDLGVFRFDSANHEMWLTDIHPGVQLEDIKTNVGWPLKIADHLLITEPPTAEELRIIREELDPDRIYI
ncbi:CoA-transferase subunit beta [candidate division KSB1 bacterium]|nr:MAG: CoA-transferase subunit beta [candidate division KSB1 bacterium]MBC6949775.1 CoA-transferase subunit beta [candidate division KSB1 bacterium]MCE7943029.1 CoA-transferase subunit beta [Chlorobi bacterium CHB1]MDL1876201.1 CoA-transferase subunit beta [Cytophagia bacterium CHB2]RIK72240.1 MAG: 3-oxoadipate--succinyl-CoA transferase subunit B [candidate division KSB1 bacterium]